jgi:hypothetical protein
MNAIRFPHSQVFKICHFRKQALENLGQTGGLQKTDIKDKLNKLRSNVYQLLNVLSQTTHSNLKLNKEYVIKALKISEI